MLKRLLVYIILMIPAFSNNQLGAADWKQVVDLRGKWLFTVGDDPLWAMPSANTSDWDQLPVGEQWENYYIGYNGFGWYRKSFDLKYQQQFDPILFLGYIDDVDEVFVNGVKVGQSGAFPPYFQTAYNIERQYRLPRTMLKESGNVIAVRVYDNSKPGGIIGSQRIGIYYDTDNRMLDLDLSGDWKFSIRENADFYSLKFDDSSWGSIHVPATWESCGYMNYYGLGFYRKQFELPASFKTNKLYLVIGKIDDVDKVYLNGKLIGKSEDLKGYDRFNKNKTYKLHRVYAIPEGLIKQKNLLAVEVLNYTGIGGIYEGPVGIMNEQNMKLYMEKYKDGEDPSAFEVLIKYIFE